MKKLVVVLCFSMFVSMISAQEKFVVPSPSDQEKYQSSAWQWNGAYIILVSYAKSLGKSPEEAGLSVGEIAKSSWSQEVGYDGFVKTMLYIWVTFAPKGAVEITEQLDSKITFVVKDFYPALKEMLTTYNVTYDEYLLFLNNYAIKLAEHLGFKYGQKSTEEGLILTIAK